MHRSPVLIATALALLAGLLASVLSGQIPPPQDEKAALLKRLAAAEKALKEAQSLTTMQNAVLKDFEKRIAELEAWHAKLPAVVASLSQGIEKSRKSGFTRAGANMRAREELLTALSRFGKDLSATSTTPPKKQ
ncbi:MAG: hypothetical protein CMJ83_21320 [Planctomycetes bacterium]|nr:hypothetical protein [Planctomycetota bacterium]